MDKKVDDDNIQHDGKKQVPGYPSLAGKMGATPQHAILRSFSALGMQNLLYYQAELVYVEDRLRKVETRCLAQGDGSKQYQFARDWDELRRSWKARLWDEKDDGSDNLRLLSSSSGAGTSCFDDIPRGTDGELLRLVLRLRATLKQYSRLIHLLNFLIIPESSHINVIDKAVIQQFSMSNLPQPDAQDLHHLKQWLADPKGGDYSLDGIDSGLWESSDDLFALRERPDTDKLSEWVVQDMLPYYHRHLGRIFKRPDPEGDSSVTYTENYFLSAFVTILSSALIVVPVVVLHAVKLMNIRLGLLALFTVIFSLCVSALTNAKRGEVFVATAT
ncbi:uncharacterized protein PAC_05637 [Phialocephala subalpina]|uniref:DUF6594 domain-containing protein n=1 Tax=Phialocephala subalpina TaxID=576137 RepID=A0A1L7WSK2_9HELO|nr:uncharacterized protein PAC_05637 [Phialocephala subalpina]